MGEANCIYIDANKKWWTADIKGNMVIGDGDITLIEEKTEELQNHFKDGFVEFINLVAPHILFVTGESIWHGTDPRDRKVVYPN